MQTYGEEFYLGLLGSAGISEQSDWQGYIDTVLNPVFDVLDTDGFGWDMQQTDYDYFQIIKDRRKTPMAIYADIDSNVQPFGTKGWRVYGGTIPTMKVRKNRSRADIRKYREAAKVLSGGDVSSYALDQLFEVGGGIYTSHANSLTYQRHQMVSGAKLKLTPDNNPYGIVDHEFFANVPTDNITNLTGAARIWTDATRSTAGANADPIGVVKKLVKDIRRKHGNIALTMEVDYDTMMDYLDHPSVVAALAAKIFATQPDQSIAQANVLLLDEDERINALQRIFGLTIKVVDSIVTVEKWDKASKELYDDDIKSFQENVFVIRPTGQIGTIKNVRPDRMGVLGNAIVNGTYADFFGGRGLLIHEVKPLQFVEYLESELTALCVPNVPQLMYYINLTGTAEITGVRAPMQTRVGGVSSPVPASAQDEEAPKRGRKPKSEETETVNVESEE